MNRHRLVQSIKRASVPAAIVLTAVLLSAVSTAAADAVSPPKACGTFTGPHWNFGGHAGNQYGVYSAKGGPCPLALTWAPRLVKQKPHGPHNLLTGPTGWGCIAQMTEHGSGFCGQLGDNGKVFGWAPKLS
jgi:hypothetical protein